MERDRKTTIVLICLVSSGDESMTLPKELGSDQRQCSLLAQDGAPQERLIVRGIRVVVGRLGMGWDLAWPPVPGAQWSQHPSSCLCFHLILIS